MANLPIPFCSLCIKDGVENPAIHWCTDCPSFLCHQCDRYHQRSKASKNHETIPAENYKELPGFIKNTGNRCLIHDKRVEKFCSIHECACCVLCVADKHKKCKDLKNIEEVLSKIKSSAFMSGVKDKLMILYENCGEILTHLEEEELSVSRQKQRKLIEVQNKRRVINSHLDKLDQQLSDEIESRSSKLINKFKASAEKVRFTKDAIMETITGWDAMSNNATDLQTLCGLNAIDEKIKADSEFLNVIQNDEELNESNFEIRYSPMLDSITTMDNFGFLFISHETKQLSTKTLEGAHLVTPIHPPSLESIKPTLSKIYFAPKDKKLL